MELLHSHEQNILITTFSFNEEIISIRPHNYTTFLSEYNMLYLWKAFGKLPKFATLKQTNVIINLIHLKTSSRVDAQ